MCQHKCDKSDKWWFLVSIVLVVIIGYCVYSPAFRA